MAFAGAATKASPQTNGALTDLQLLSAAVGADGSVGFNTSETADWGYQSLTASGNTLCKTGAGQLHSLIVGTATGNITIYDGTTSGGTVILATSALPAAGVYNFNVGFVTGLFIVLSGAGVATVTGS